MQIKTLPRWISLEALRAAILYPLAYCEAEPLAAAHVPKFKALLLAWSDVATKKVELDVAAAIARARCDRANDRLNVAADRVSAELLILTRHGRDHAMYKHFFGDDPVSLFKREKLDRKRKAMRGWIEGLSKSGAPTLKALISEVTAAVVEADKAVGEKASAELAKRQFRNIGERKQFIDKVNAVRKSVHGQLGKLPHEILGLPNDFADLFFRPAPTSDDESKAKPEAPTIESVTANLEELAQRIEAKRAQLEALKARASEEAKAAAAREADKAALAELRKSIAEKEKLAEALQAKLDGE